jgi:hypothetical protein
MARVRAAEAALGILPLKKELKFDAGRLEYASIARPTQPPPFLQLAVQSFDDRFKYIRKVDKTIDFTKGDSPGPAGSGATVCGAASPVGGAALGVAGLCFAGEGAGAAEAVEAAVGGPDRAGLVVAEVEREKVWSSAAAAPMSSAASAAKRPRNEGTSPTALSAPIARGHELKC